MATRLNADLRAAIIKNAVKKSSVPEMRAVYEERLKKWIDDVWLLAVGGKKGLTEIEKAKKLVSEIKSKLPENVLSGYGLLNLGNSVRLNLAGMSFRVYFVGSLQQITGYNLDQNYRVCPDSFTIEGTHPLHQRFLDLESFKGECDSQEQTIRANVGAAVHSVTTVEKLLEVWPEASELIPDLAIPTHKGLAVIPAELNTMIGLPSGKKRGAK